MDILDVDLPPPHDDDHEQHHKHDSSTHPQQRSTHVDGDSSEHHALLESAAVAGLDASTPLPDESGMALHDDDDGDDHDALLRSDASSNHIDSSATSNRRRKIGKALQLLLLRKYVQCATQLARLPSRATTEQLLDDAYDEFFLQGGSLSEPRLDYAAFLKLVRNRRGEVLRRPRGVHTRSSSHGRRRHENERLEIRSLITELERVRPSHVRGALDLEALDNSDDDCSSHAAGGDGGAPTSSSSSVTAAALLAVEPCLPASASHLHCATAAASTIGSLSPVLAAADSARNSAAVYANVGDATSSRSSSSSSSSSSLLLDRVATDSDAVLVPRARLDMMLRFAQETLAAQKKILDDVRAIERRLDLHQL